MKITPKSQSGLTHDFNVVVAAADIEKQMEQELQSYGKRAKIPGFRPGKIPMNILKQRYGKDVLGEVIQQSVNKATREALSKKDIRPALQPDIKIVDYQEGGDLEFDLSVEAMPDVPEIEFEKMEVTKYIFEVDEKDVDEGIERLAVRQKHLHDADAKTKAKQGDVVKIDFVGKRDGVPFEGGTGTNFQLELGSGQFIPGFEEQLVGSKAGDEVEVSVTFPKEYHSESLAGAKAIFEVKVHSVHNVHVPDVNDDLAKQVGFDSLDKLKDAVREQIAGDYEALARNRSKKELFDTLDEKVKFEVPEKMREMEFEGIWKQLQEAKAKGDESLDKPDAELKKEYTKIAERRVRLGIILSELGRKNNIQVTNDELTRAVLDQARMFPGQEQKVFEFYQKNPQHVDELKGPILEEKAVDFILAKAKRKEKKIALAELMDTEESSSAESKKPAAKKSSAKAKKEA